MPVRRAASATSTDCVRREHYYQNFGDIISFWLNTAQTWYVRSRRRMQPSFVLGLALPSRFLDDEALPITRRFSDKIRFSNGREDHFTDFEKIDVPAVDGNGCAAIGCGLHIHLTVALYRRTLEFEVFARVQETSKLVMRQFSTTFSLKTDLIAGVSVNYTSWTHGSSQTGGVGSCDLSKSLPSPGRDITVSSHCKGIDGSCSGPHLAQ